MAAQFTVVTDLPRLAPRAADANKGTFGKVLVVAGSRGMSGAAALCATSALRGGAGLVRLAVPEGILPVVAAFNPCYTTVPLPEDAGGRMTLSALDKIAVTLADSTVGVVGPGLGRSSDLDALLREILKRTPVPLVLDADALNALVGQLDALSSCPRPCVITPHPGEFARLAGTDVPTVQANRPEVAARFARDHSVLVVLKGAGTVVTDGQRLAVNGTGNPGMATGGTGDVLTGLIGALLAQGLAPFEAARLGAHLHGLAGDLAREALGEVSLIATDVIDRLPAAFLRHQRGDSALPRPEGGV